jgi:tripartite-type tricarboxylate transporter receptor subunit TctC
VNLKVLAIDMISRLLRRNSDHQGSSHERSRQAITAALCHAAMVVALVYGPPAAADDVADFYKGKTVTLYLGYPPSGAYDIYARLIGRFMTKYLPGNPQVLVRNKPGAASLNLVNDLYNVLPRDGSVFGMFARSIALNKLLGRPGANFDAVKFNWIGSANNEVSICGVWHGVGVHSTKDFLARPLVFAANAPGAESDVYPTILNNLAGTHFKVVAGYPGVNDLTLALERGEADARCGWSWGALKAAKPDWLRDNKIYIAVQFATRKHPELPDVPLATELARTDLERAALDLILTQQTMGRPFAAPPGVPPARVDALRRAFDKALADPQLLAEAEKLELEIAPVSGEDLQALVERMFKTPREIVDAARNAIAHH